MPISPNAWIESLEKTPLILERLLKDLSPAQAHDTTDGPAGWNIVSILSHLRDSDEFFLLRVKLIQDQDNPEFPRFNPDQLAAERDYAHQDLADVLQAFKQNRQTLIDYLKALPESDWQRTGRHHRYGTLTITELSGAILIHDNNHFEQIAHTLAAAGL